MGNNEEGKSFKPEKLSSPVPPDQTTQPNPTNVHVYPDWAAMQAYYGPRVTMPPYYNSPMPPGHVPHPYMWGPGQPMMSPYAPPYAAIYSHGSVYAHPAVPFSAVMPISGETPTKSSGNTDGGLMKKLKGFEGLAMSIGNGSAQSAGSGAEDMSSQSVETERSSDGSYGNTPGEKLTRRKRNHEGTPTAGKNVKTEMQAIAAAATTPASASGKAVGSVLSSSLSGALELGNSSGISTKTSPTSFQNTHPAMAPEGWLQNERELKREKRKQSNRESARRSRLRKQAETEDLARKVESLTAENFTIKSELSRLTESTEKLKQENVTLMGKLKKTQLGRKEEISLDRIGEKRKQPVSTENLLSRVNNSGSVDRNNDEEDEMYPKKLSNSGAKLHQLLDRSPRTDAVAAT